MLPVEMGRVLVSGRGAKTGETSLTGDDLVKREHQENFLLEQTGGRRFREEILAGEKKIWGEKKVQKSATAKIPVPRCATPSKEKIYLSTMKDRLAAGGPITRNKLALSSKRILDATVMRRCR